MPVYECYGVVRASKYLGAVEADNEEQAKDKALRLESAWVSLCHQCSSQAEDPEIEGIIVELRETP